MFTTKDADGNIVQIEDNDIVWKALFNSAYGFHEDDLVFIPRCFPEQPINIPGKTFAEMCKHILVKFA